MNRPEILDAAKQIVCNDREATYGSPENNFRMIGSLWSDYLGHRISATDVTMMMTLLKIARIKTGRHKDDNFVDAAGYIACGCEISADAALQEPVTAGGTRVGSTMSAFMSE